ncbi:MAG: NRDE family protein [Syntrophales bacterium]|nr:NRDE family protein [Syntrophales bacterium]
MCLIILAYKVHPTYQLIMVANRDEFYDRPSAPADFWEENPLILAGRDLKEGGTWCGITKEGKFAALTNYRDPQALKIGAPSRGLVVRRFLESDDSPEKFLEWLKANGGKFNGFSIVFGTPLSLFHYSNRGGFGPLTPGIHGLSNALIDTPWPKVKRGVAAVEHILGNKKRLNPLELLQCLHDEKIAPDEELPNTGVGREWERLLSPLFIRSSIYGTRSTTVILLNESGKGIFIEQNFNGEKEPWMISIFHLEGPNGKKGVS